MFFTWVLGLLSLVVSAQDIFGKWKTIDDETGEEKSIVEIYEEEGKVYGKIVEILRKDRQNKKCDRCPGTKKNKPILGMIIVEALEKNGTSYSGGTILDPTKGKEYRCKIWVEEENPDVLNVRGYVAMFYRTQQWRKVK
ncbi:DUF2147 domain-containing protein [Ascidiimonas aurantiaca]|uniref:DUF2147 domain-containing protein n=1 Tax=Ascidiimonas aurantiaca TaxID=1685432 RepID=UPI0030EE18B3